MDELNEKICKWKNLTGIYPCKITPAMLDEWQTSKKTILQTYTSHDTSITIYDIQRMVFMLHHSKNNYWLAHSPEEKIPGRLDQLFRLIPGQDKKYFCKFMFKGFEAIMETEDSQRHDFRLRFYCHLLSNDNSYQLCLFKVCIFRSDAEGTPWLFFIQTTDTNYIDHKMSEDSYDIFIGNKYVKQSNAFVYQLPRRQMQILNLSKVHFNDHQIAQKLDVGYTTIKQHKKNIFSKFNTHNMTESLKIALKYDLI